MIVKNTKIKENAIKFLGNYWLFLLCGIVLLILIICILIIVINKPTDLTNWLLVYLTAIYALLTFVLAFISIKSTLVAERSAKAMEASVKEAIISRIAAYSAMIAFPEGQTYIENEDSTVIIKIQNLFRQPVFQLSIFVWKMEVNKENKREVKYSSMLKHGPIDIAEDKTEIVLKLSKPDSTDSDCVTIGTIALQRYLQFNQEPPKSALCLIVYFDRATASNGPNLFVYDLKPKDKSWIVV